MTILFTDIVSTTRHRVKQQTACNFTARTTAFFGFSGIESIVLRDWTGSYKKTNKKENTLIDIKIKLNLPSLISALIHRVWQRASITGYNKNTEMESIRFSE